MVLILGVLADTHGRLHPRAIPAFAAAGVEQILHAGDVGRPAVLEELAQVAPVIAVRGNVDHGEWATRLPEVVDRVIAGRRVVMTHIAGNPQRLVPAVAALLAESQAELFICGHSHRPLLASWAPGRYWLNPGAAGRQGFHKRATIALVRFSANGIQAELRDLGPK